jgi:formate hydrogenlyase transcriptional activator
MSESQHSPDFRLFQFQAALMELSRDQSASLEESLRRITSVAAASLDVARVSVWLFNEDFTELRCELLYDRNHNAYETGAVLAMPHYPRYFQAMQDSRTIAAHDAARDPATAEFASGYLDAFGITSMLDVPLRREGRPIGVLCNEHVGPQRMWRISEQTFAGSLADLTALVLETDRRRRAERELRRSLEQLELFFSQSLDGFFFMMLDEPVHWQGAADKERTLDYIFEHQKITKVNLAMLRQYGMDSEQLLGATPAQMFAHNLAHGHDLWRRMLDAGRLHAESEERRSDGSTMWVEGDYICLYDNQGRFCGHFGVQRDVTERKQAEEALRRYNQRLRLLRQTDRAILAVRSVEEIAGAALRGLRELVPCLRASVAMIEPGAPVARLVGVRATGETRLGPGAEVSLEMLGDLEELRAGRPHVVDHIAQMPAQARAALEAEGVRSFVNIPLLGGGELIGTLNLAAAHFAAFTAEHVEIAQEVAERLAVAIVDARLNQQVLNQNAELERRVEERTAELSQANQRLRESRERVRALYDNTPVMMHSIDANGCLLDVNNFWLQKMGYERHEVIGQPLTRFATPETARVIVEEKLPQLKRDGFLKEYEGQGVRKNGEIIDVVASSLLTRGPAGEFLHSQAFLIDVTEKKRAERARREADERLAGILRSAMDAIVAVDARRQIVIFNEAAGKVFRCPPADAVGRPLDAFLSEPLRQLLTSYMTGSEAPQMWVPEGMLAVRKDGERFPVEATLSRTEVSTGPLFTLILRDINARKQAEEMLEQLQRANIYLQEELQNELNFEEIVGASPAIQRVFQAIEMVAQTDSTVLLLGETGTGKELIARAVHNRSRRKLGVMVKVNCGALPASLVESELFGHEKGAFTGAVAQKKGRFELAHRGTILLDEAGELPLETQAKLLRILQEQEFERVGGSQTVKVDVRVIAATNRDLEAEVRRGAFRADLFYRLNVFPIEVPPLRERKEDIPLLASYFVRRFSQRMGKRIQRIHRAVYDQFMNYDWPGNVRELANLLERAVIHCQGETLQPQHVTLERRAARAAAPAPDAIPTLEEGERQLIRRALQHTGGVLAGPNGAAALLGINRSTLWSRMRKLGIEAPKGRAAAGDGNGAG